MKAMGGGWYEAAVRSGESGRRLTAAPTSVLDRRLISPFSPAECKVRSARDVIDKKMGQWWVDGGGDDDRCIYIYIYTEEGAKKKMKTPHQFGSPSRFS